MGYGGVGVFCMWDMQIFVGRKVDFGEQDNAPDSKAVYILNTMLPYMAEETLQMWLN